MHCCGTAPIGGDFPLRLAASNSITHNKFASNEITYNVFASNRFICDMLLHSSHHGRTSLSLLSGTVFLQTSGYYWLKSTSTDSQEVYCAMDTTYCDITGGWMRLAYFNMTKPGVSCPTSLRQINTPAKLCGRPGTGCYGVTFPTDGICYSKVCRQAWGYQYYSPDALGHSSNNINSQYVDGVGITNGSPRQHLWTYAAGLSADGNYGGDRYTCPCATPSGLDPPMLVRQYYYCESSFTADCHFYLSPFHFWLLPRLLSQSAFVKNGVDHASHR